MGEEPRGGTPAAHHAGVAARIVTFNAGLAVGFLPHVTERLPHVIDALAALDVDLLFVQEVWLETHWEQLREALHAKMPHAMRPVALLASEPGACSEQELAPFVACAEKHCGGLRDEALAQCVVRHCAGAAFGMASPCVNCLASHPVGTLEEIVGRCVGRGEATPRAAGTTSRASLMAYGGSFGTGLFSRTPIPSQHLHTFDSTVNARGALHVRANLPDVGDVDVFATHLSPGGHEHGVQVGELLRWIDPLMGARPAVLLGDLNTSEGSEAFRQIERAGFHPPATRDTRGTFSSSGLETGVAGDGGWRIDHVLFRDVVLPTRTERILDAPIALEVDGAKVRSTLSDHFGILATIG
ncbi:MAG: hypothetical protein JWP97_6433 [Labilithrix sp.]|nr:hypothetical protein [Labilithrix sp.]